MCNFLNFSIRSRVLIFKSAEHFLWRFSYINKGDNGEDYLRIIFYYTLTSIDENDIMSLKQTLVSHLNGEEENNVMVSIAQRWFDDGKMTGKMEGIMEGKLEAVEETAINMLKHNLALPLISSVTGLPILKYKI